MGEAAGIPRPIRGMAGRLRAGLPLQRAQRAAPAALPSPGPRSPNTQPKGKGMKTPNIANLADHARTLAYETAAIVEGEASDMTPADFEASVSRLESKLLEVMREELARQRGAC